MSKLTLVLSLLIINTVLFLVLPINLEKHYIFPLVLLLFLSIAALPKYFSFTTAAVVVLFWSQPYFIRWNTIEPVRTIADMQSCYQQFCQDFTKPTYVSMESGILTGYHNALEHQFFLREAGCKVYDITESQDKASTMLVIGDNTDYTPGKSAYYELTLFGPATVSAEVRCTDRLRIYQLEKF